MLDIFQSQIFQNSLIAVIIATIVSGFIGTYIVSRKLVFMSGGISHIAFGGIGLAFFIGINPIYSAIIFALLSVLIISILSRKSKVNEDSLIGILWAFGMAIGIIFVSLTPGYLPTLESYLFGNVAIIERSDIFLMIILTVIVIFTFIFLYQEILITSFQEDFAKTQKVPVWLINYIMLNLVALTVVIFIRITGIVLIIALLTIPQTISMLIKRSFLHTIIMSIVVGSIASAIGLVISVSVNKPRGLASGATIVLVLISIFILSYIVSKIILKIKKPRYSKPK